MLEALGTKRIAISLANVFFENYSLAPLVGNGDGMPNICPGHRKKTPENIQGTLAGREGKKCPIKD